MISRTSRVRSESSTWVYAGEKFPLAARVYGDVGYSFLTRERRESAASRRSAAAASRAFGAMPLPMNLVNIPAFQCHPEPSNTLLKDLRRCSVEILQSLRLPQDDRSFPTPRCAAALRPQNDMNRLEFCKLFFREPLPEQWDQYSSQQLYTGHHPDDH